MKKEREKDRGEEREREQRGREREKTKETGRKAGPGKEGPVVRSERGNGLASDVMPAMAA